MVLEWGYLYICNYYRKFCNFFVILFIESKRLGVVVIMKDKYILLMEIRFN